MPLTPKEIELKTFSASFRGYAEDEVDVFLEEVIISVSEYQQMIRERDAVIAESGRAVPAAGAASVAGANEEANRILQAAQRQADEILTRARLEAAEMEAGAAVGAAGGLFTDAERAQREKLIQGYQRLRDELSAVRARVQKALGASEEAFGILEQQVGGMLESAGPIDAVADEPSPESTQLPTPSAEPAEFDLERDRGTFPGVPEESEPAPKRPWER